YSDPYFYSPPIYRYYRGASYYEVNQYGADLLRRAVNYGYREGYRAVSRTVKIAGTSTTAIPMPTRTRTTDMTAIAKTKVRTTTTSEKASTAVTRTATTAVINTEPTRPRDRSSPVSSKIHNGSQP